MMKLKNIFITGLIIVLAIAGTYGGFRFAFKELIFPHIEVGGVNVTGLSKSAAIGLVNASFEANPNSLSLQTKGVEVSKLNQLVIKRDTTWAVEQAHNIGRSGNLLTQFTEEVNALLNKRKVEIPVIYDKEEFGDILDEVVGKFSHPPKWPKLENKEGKIVLVKGESGIEIKRDELEKQINKALSLPGKQIVNIPTVEISTEVNQELVNSAMAAMSKWQGKKLVLKFREFETVVDQTKMLSLFGLTNEPINNESYEQLVKDLKPSIEIDAKDAVLVFENNKVNEFKPEVIGAVIDIPAFKEKLTRSLMAGEEITIEVPTILSYPKIKAGDINNLGIKELIGSGKSSFSHSIPGRVFNVNLAASRIKGTVVAPGEEFSFNQSVGEISKTTGYQTAYIISGGRTVLGDGGGVCQVSTTVFRAALNAGLPITERRSHAYRVGYYEQDSPPGIDATIFYPSADLRFLNDTGHHILVQTTVNTKDLTMKVDLFGTKDGRVATVTTPKISSQTPPPPTMYVDDPTLPKDVLKQIDWAASGAKVSFDYKVEKNGQTVYQKTFFSNYQPWQAIYLRGTGG